MKETRLWRAINASESELKGFLANVAVEYGLNYQEMADVIMCESGWRTDVFSAGNVSYGVAQFTRPTFDGYCQGFGEYEDPFAQLECMGFMFSKKMQGRWDCWRMLYE